jgi:predicted dehydrogenase
LNQVRSKGGSDVKKYKIGIIGCGFAAHGAGPNEIHMPSLSKLEDVELAAFCDRIEDRAVDSAREFGAKGAKVYTDYKGLLKDKSIDIVHVCTPNESHAEITVAALKAGKHVYCEKPMAKTSAEGVKMLEAAKRTGKKLSVGYQYRYKPDCQLLNKMCRRGDLGEIYFAKAHALRRRAVPTWGVFLNEKAQGGGALIDIGTHALDITLWMMNNYKPKSVTGSIYKKFAPETDTANFFGDWDPAQFTVEDSAFGFIKMEDGATIFLEASWALNILEGAEARTTLCGTKAGADMVDGLRINKADLNKLVVTQALRPSTSDIFEIPPSPPNGYLMARAWIDSIRNDSDPFVLPEQALVVTQILEAIYESARTGKTVYF